MFASRVSRGIWSALPQPFRVYGVPTRCTKPSGARFFSEAPKQREGMYFLNPMGLSFAMLFGGTAYAFYRMTDGERHGPSKPPTQHQVPAAAVAKPANNVISRDVEQYPCYMDVSVDGKQLGRVVFELFWAEAPKTAENFRALCVGDVDPKLSFKGSRFHRIIPRFMVQGGDITRGDGMGGMSIYGAKFADEPFVHKHDTAGLLSMANAGPNTNGSQFFITLEPCPHLDGRHVVFGRVIDGMHVVEEMQKYGSYNGRVRKPVVVSACGQIVPPKEGK